MSDSEEENVIVKRRTPARVVSSSSGSEHESNAAARGTRTQRSSARLRDKARKTFSIPSRKEALEQVSPGNMTYRQSNIRQLKPRNLVNNYLRE